MFRGKNAGYTIDVEPWPTGFVPTFKFAKSIIGTCIDKKSVIGVYPNDPP